MRMGGYHRRAARRRCRSMRAAAPDGRVRGRRPTGHQATHEAGDGFRFLFRAPAGLRNLDVTERALDTTGPASFAGAKGIPGRQGSTRGRLTAAASHPREPETGSAHHPPGLRPRDGYARRPPGVPLRPTLPAPWQLRTEFAAGYRANGRTPLGHGPRPPHGRPRRPCGPSVPADVHGPGRARRCGRRARREGADLR